MSGLREAFEQLVEDVPAYGDLDRAIEQVEAERPHRPAVIAGLAAAAAVVAVVAGLSLIDDDQSDSQDPVDPTTETPTETENATLSRKASDVVAVSQSAQGLTVEGEVVPGTWQLMGIRRDVWVGFQTDENDATSQWWGKGATAHQMPPAVGDFLPGGVVISEDARFIAWTRPAADVFDPNPPMVMEVVETATGEVRWSRSADSDAYQIGTLAVTNDGVVVFAHCLEPFFDGEGQRQCGDARVDVWSPQADVVRALPDEVAVRFAPLPEAPATWGDLVQPMGAHNGLLVRSSETARPHYVRVSNDGQVEVVATLPTDTKAVTADERFALVGGEVGSVCVDDEFRCGWWVLSLDSGERRPIPSLKWPVSPGSDFLDGFVVEGDDLLLVSEGHSGDILARCSLAQAQCVALRR